MTNDQIRLHFGELNAAEMRLARAIVGWHEAREAKLRTAADGLAEALEQVISADTTIYWSGDESPPTKEEGDCAAIARAALAAYQATKP